MEVSDGVEHPDPDPHRHGRRAERRTAGLADRPLDGQRPARRPQLQRPAAPGHAPALVAHPMDRPAPRPPPSHPQNPPHRPAPVRPPPASPGPPARPAFPGGPPPAPPPPPWGAGARAPARRYIATGTY